MAKYDSYFLVRHNGRFSDSCTDANCTTELKRLSWSNPPFPQDNSTAASVGFAAAILYLLIKASRVCNRSTFAY
jgi:hypothetical protein